MYFSVCKQHACQIQNIRHLETSLKFWTCVLQTYFKLNFLIKVVLTESKFILRYLLLAVSRETTLFLRFHLKASQKNLKNISIIRTFFEKAFRTSFIFSRYIVVDFIFGAVKGLSLSAPSHSHLCFVSRPFDIYSNSILSSFFSIKFPAHCSATQVNPSRVVSKDYTA